MKRVTLGDKTFELSIPESEIVKAIQKCADRISVDYADKNPMCTWGNKNHIGTVTAYSTKNALSEGIYIDLDIGECYMIKNGEIISLNTYVNLGADLPTLKPGANIITYDNTIDELKITPRYWRV